MIIEHSKGAVSVRCGTTPEAAFEMIRALARSQRRSLHDLAAEVVKNGGRFS